MRRAIQPSVVAVPTTVAVATESALPGRLTRSKMARKPGTASATQASSSSDDGTPTPVTEGYAEPVTPSTVVQVKGLVFFCYFKHFIRKLTIPLFRQSTLAFLRCGSHGLELHCVICCVIWPLSLNVLGGTWKRVSSPDIRDMSAWEVCHHFTESRYTNWHLLTWLTSGCVKFLFLCYS